MEAAAIRAKLHECIDQADTKHLEALYLLLEKELDPNYKYDAATLDMLYKRRESHLNEQSLSYSPDEAIEQIKKEAGKK